MRHRFFGAALTVSGGKRAQAMEERAWQLSRLDAWKREGAPTLAAKSYTTHHLSVGVGRCVALSNTHMLLNTHTHTHTQFHRIGKSCECEATGSEIQMEYVQEEKR